MRTRFRETTHELTSYLKTFLVRCPRCNELAVVQGEGWQQPSRARVTCSHCGYARSKAYDSTRRFRAQRVAVRARCGWCRQLLSQKTVIRTDAAGDQTAPMRCSACSSVTLVPIQLPEFSAQRGRDPLFGLALWLQVECSGKLLWAYNEEHLDFLIDYIGSDLRERVPNISGWLASRLPSWMKWARNRKPILRALLDLRESLPH